MAKWTIREIEFLKANCKHLTVREMADELKRHPEAVSSAMIRYGIKTGRDGKFRPGHAPANKGTKGLKGANRTSFKPGSVPYNTKHDGAITTRKDSSGTAYKYLRIAKNKWVLYHRYLWEQANGPIPSGHIVTFIDGNPMNCELSNLQVISRAENAKRNSNRPKAAITMKANWEKVRKFESLGIQPHGIKLKTKRKPIEATVPARVDAEQLRIAKDFFNSL